MFKILKKIYFKIYHLLKLLGVFVIAIVGVEKVKADEVYYCSKTENKVISNNFIDGYVNPFGTAKPTNFFSITYSGIIEIKGDTQYTFKFMSNPGGTDPYRVIYMFYDENKEYIETKHGRTTYANYFYQNTSPINAKYMILGLYHVSAVNANNVQYVLYEGDNWTNANITTPIIEYQQCDPPVTPTPEATPEPTPTTNETYDNFLKLYINRFNYLAEGSISNPYLFAMIGIIIAWVVLELFLRILHIRGGYKKK